MGVRRDTKVLLRRTLQTVANQVSSAEDPLAIEPEKKRGRALSAAVAAAAVLCIVVAYAVLLQQEGSGSRVGLAQQADPSKATDVTMPYAVPSDTALITSVNVSPANMDPSLRSFYQRTYDGTYNGTGTHIDMYVQKYFQATDQARNCGGTAVVVAGVEGCTFKSIEGGGTATEITRSGVVWQPEPNVVISFTATELSPDQAIALANSVHLLSDGSSASLDPLPDGIHASGEAADQYSQAEHVAVAFTVGGCDFSLTRDPASPGTNFPGGSAPTAVGSYQGAYIGTQTIAWFVNGSFVNLSVASGTGSPVGNDQACDLVGTAAKVRYLSSDSWDELLTTLGPRVKGR
jgi:hypothetical protein